MFPYYLYPSDCAHSLEADHPSQRTPQSIPIAVLKRLEKFAIGAVQTALFVLRETDVPRLPVLVTVMVQTDDELGPKVRDRFLRFENQIFGAIVPSSPPRTPQAVERAPV